MLTSVRAYFSDASNRSRMGYIIEAALEYFITLLVSGAFLTTLLLQNGIPDSLTGMISAVGSLAGLVQIFAIFLARIRKVKGVVTLIMLLNQLIFSSLYLIPFIDIPSNVKTIIFVVFLLGSHLLTNLVAPSKTNWLTSLIDRNKMGIFTAKKEIVSLIGGMVFSLLMGRMVDHYKAIGEELTAFILCGITIFVLCILHTVTMLIIKKPEETPNAVEHKKVNIFQDLSALWKNKAFRSLLLMQIIWSGATLFSTSYFSVYEIQNLGFSLTFISILAMMGSISRIIVSPFVGRFADRNSWSKTLILCVSIASFAFLINSFCNPATGKVIYPIYQCLYAISMAGINGGMVNIIFDYIPAEQRTSALGFKSAIGGLTGFLTSIVGGWVVGAVQSGGNQILGMTIYAQQIMSFITFLAAVFLVVFLKLTIDRLPKLEQQTAKK